jgi:tetratricopeptide (TPR) repeat protein
MKVIYLTSGIKRLAAAAAALLCIVAAVFAAKWCFADTVASHADLKDVAAFAIGFAPSDPQTHYALARLSENSFLVEDLPLSLSEYEKAAALSPNDYRLWVALSGARGRSGDQQGAESAMRRALVLAPAYARLHWTLGNVLLRTGKTDEGFSEIRVAATSNPAEFAAPAVGTAWQLYDGDPSAVIRAIGDTPAANAVLAVFLARQKRFDEAVNLWHALPADEKKTTFKDSGTELFSLFTTAFRFSDALKIQQEAGTVGDTFTPGKIFNPGFEFDVKSEKASLFDWQIGDGVQPQVGFDDKQKHGGNRSMAIVFNTPTGKESRQLQQTVVVEPGKKYKLTVFCRSELKTAGSLHWEIVEAGTGKALGATNAAANNTDWTQLQAEFTSSVDAATIRLSPLVCGAGICPTTGKILFDDFNLEKL